MAKKTGVKFMEIVHQMFDEEIARCLVSVNDHTPGARLGLKKKLTDLYIFNPSNRCLSPVCSVTDSTLLDIMNGTKVSLHVMDTESKILSYSGMVIYFTYIKWRSDNGGKPGFMADYEDY